MNKVLYGLLLINVHTYYMFAYAAGSESTCFKILSFSIIDPSSCKQYLHYKHW